MDPKYGSHLIPLLRLLDKTDGPVLEMGMGIWSTPMMHLICEGNRYLVSFDTDTDWFTENEKWASEYHEVYLIGRDKWDSAPIDTTKWSVVLIDHKPGIRRHVDALRLKDNAEFILIHDSEPEIDRFYKYSRIYKHFKYVYHYTKVFPHTTILSNFIDPAIFLD